MGAFCPLMCVPCPGSAVIFRSCPGCISIRGYTTIIATYLYNAVFVFLRRFIIVVNKVWAKYVTSHLMLILQEYYCIFITSSYGIYYYVLLSVGGWFLSARATAGGWLRWCPIVPGIVTASSVQCGIGSRCCPWLVCAGGKVAIAQGFNSCN